MILNLVHIYSSTVLLLKKTLCISRSWPSLVLTTALETLGRPLMLKISRENVIWKYLNFPIHFFKFLCDYDLNLCRYLNPELPPILSREYTRVLTVLCHFASLYFLNRHTNVGGTVSPRIKLNQLYLRKRSSTYKSAILADINGYIEKQSIRIFYYTMVQYFRK